MTLKFNIKTKYYTDSFNTYNDSITLKDSITNIVNYCKRNEVTTISNYLNIMFGLFGLLVIILF